MSWKGFGFAIMSRRTDAGTVIIKEVQGGSGKEPPDRVVEITSHT